LRALTLSTGAVLFVGAALDLFLGVRFIVTMAGIAS
jgi:hypothetical protein